MFNRCLRSKAKTRPAQPDAEEIERVLRYLVELEAFATLLSTHTNSLERTLSMLRGTSGGFKLPEPPTRPEPEPYVRT